MIKSQPKSSMIISIGAFLIIILIVDAWLFYGLIKSPSSYLWLKLILTPILLVVAIAIGRKGYMSTLSITINNSILTYKYLFGSKKSFKISEIINWNEEVVKSRNGEYKQLSIMAGNGKVFRLSNQENSHYQSVVNYLKKKVKTRKHR